MQTWSISDGNSRCSHASLTAAACNVWAVPPLAQCQRAPVLSRLQPKMQIGQRPCSKTQLLYMRTSFYLFIYLLQVKQPCRHATDTCKTRRKNVRFPHPDVIYRLCGGDGRSYLVLGGRCPGAELRLCAGMRSSSRSRAEQSSADF